MLTDTLVSTNSWFAELFKARGEVVATTMASCLQSQFMILTIKAKNVNILQLPLFVFFGQRPWYNTFQGVLTQQNLQRNHYFASLCGHLNLCFVNCFWKKDTSCTPKDGFHLHKEQLKHVVPTWTSLYLEGATPTRFGPRPRKSDLGPSFSRIDLKQN